MRSLTQLLLTCAVFITGASILIIEVVGLRILAPYFGNTIFTVSSVITVILVALSCGYYAGGRLSDKYPSFHYFFALIFFSGLLLLCSLTIGRFILAATSSKLSISLGPLVSATLLFLFPALLLGMMCPYAIKLQSVHLPEKGVGSVAGSIFFWSTLGSIAGSLSAGFLLIPHFGIDRILISTGAVLSTVGLVSLLFLGIRKGRARQLIVLLALALGGAYFATVRIDGSALYRRDGVYARITIYDGQYGGRPVRFFQQDENSAGAGEGAMFLDSNDPTDLVYDYTRYYSLYKIFTPRVDNALVIGGGAYSVPKALLQELPQASIDVVDIEPSLFSLAQRYFRVPQSPRLHNHVQDGRRFLRDSSKQYDLIFSDVYYSFFSVPPQFTTQEFFGEAKARLTPNGIFIVNVVGDLSRQQPSLVMAEIKTFQTVFPNSYFFAVAWPERTDSQNIMLVGCNSTARVDLDTASAPSRDPLLRSLRTRLLDVDSRFELSPYPVLTDDFSPVEFLTAQVLKRAFAEPKPIDGEEMLADVAQQVRYGNRYVGTSGHERVRKFLLSEMNLLAQEVKTQSWTYSGRDGKTYDLTNIIGRFYSGERRVVIATHYDSSAAGPASGPNGASGVGVLLELARALDNSNLPPKFGIDLVFFDGAETQVGEQTGSPRGQLLGSTYFAHHLDELYGQTKPVAAIVVDAVCNANLEMVKKQSETSNAAATGQAIGDIGRELGSPLFLGGIGNRIEDDQLPLTEAGLPSVLLADSESLQLSGGANAGEKCSARSLESVGQTLMNYVLQNISGN